MVTLTEGDLEQIADEVTLATEDKWVALEEQHKAVINTIQAELRTLQLKIDMLRPAWFRDGLP